MREKLTSLGIDEVEFDDENPRIKGALEKYGDKITADRIHFALQSSSDEGAKNTSGFHNLKISIKANGGIAEPIKVVERDGRFICIDGNTRLAIYRDFARKEGSDKWGQIPCMLLEGATQLDVETIRVTAHLVGARQWPAYEKAKYLNHLRYEKLMDYDEMIALCGGNRHEIEQQIDAFDDMNEYYRDRVEDGAFRPDRFSGFVELQRRKKAIFEAGFNLADFGDWIHNGNISALADVRLLPRVLSDPEAKEVLVKGGVNSIRKANRLVEDKHRNTDKAFRNLDDVSIGDLASALSARLENLTMSDLGKLKDDDEGVVPLQVLSERLAEALGFVGK